MNIVFLSPDYSPTWYRFCVGLRDVGATVFGMGASPYDGLRQELRESLTDYRTVNPNDYDDLLRTLRYFSYQHGKIDRIDSLNEYALRLEARLRDDFNVPGVRANAVEAMTRKSLMKRKFVQAGMSVARGRICRRPQDVWTFLEQVGYPVVAKPDIGVGAINTFRLDSDHDVERYLATRPPGEYLVEEFLTGTMVAYDGLTDRSGEVVFDSALVYNVGVMEAVNLGLDFSYYIPREIRGDLRDAGRAILHAFNVRERAFHLEFFDIRDKGLVPLEVNMRPPGDPAVDMFNFAHDIDFYREWANVVVHDRFESSVGRQSSCIYVGRRASRAYIRSREDVNREFGDLLVQEGPMDPAWSESMGDYAFIMRGPELEPLLAAARAIQAPMQTSQGNE